MKTKKPTPPQKPSQAKGGKKPSGKAKVAHITAAANGGFSVTHETDNDGDEAYQFGSSKPHVFADSASMMKHVGKLFGHNPVAGEPDGDEKANAG